MSSQLRRHDLDALRGFAMLLGIALHATIAYSGNHWMVEDPARDSALTVFFLSLHGFRLPLFFVLSGFFTTMLWKRRGLGYLVKHRTKRGRAKTV